jgi:hypothetical protein
MRGSGLTRSSTGFLSCSLLYLIAFLFASATNPFSAVSTGRIKSMSHVTIKIIAPTLQISSDREHAKAEALRPETDNS